MPPRHALFPREKLASSTRIACLAMALTLLAAGCSLELPGKPNPADRPRTPEQIIDFTVLYAQNCSGCHGAQGTLGPAPPLNDPIFRAIVSHQQLVDVITHGRPGTPMPAFARHLSGTLDDKQIEILAEGVRQHWKGGQLPEAALPEYASGASQADAQRGQEIFARACAECHGENGKGSSDPSPGALNEPYLLSLMSEAMLRRIIITGRPDLGMPSFADDMGRTDYKPLSSDEIDDLVALLASWREQPPGEPAKTASATP